MKAILYVSSTAKDTDFTAKLVDVYPDAVAHFIWSRGYFWKRVIATVRSVRF